MPRSRVGEGQAAGSTQSGAVVNPRGLRRLFRGSVAIEEMPFYGEVEAESVYFMKRGTAIRIPTPPTMKNHGNYVASLSQLTRWLAERAEEAGATVLPETAGESSWSPTDRCVCAPALRPAATDNRAQLRAGIRHHRSRDHTLWGTRATHPESRSPLRPAGDNIRSGAGREGVWRSPARSGGDPTRWDGRSGPERSTRVRRSSSIDGGRHGHDRHGGGSTTRAAISVHDLLKE